MALIDPPLYLQADAHPARTFRQLITAVLGEGILGSTSFAVTQRGAGANFSVDVAAGMAVITGDSATQQGRYLVVNDATVNDASTVVTSAPSAGNHRYDLVVLEIKDNAEDAGGINAPRFRVVAGTPSSTGAGLPAEPAVPISSLVLARIGPILNSTTTITNALILDRRVVSRLANELVTTASIENRSVTEPKIGLDAIHSANIADGTIIETDLNSAVLSSAWTDVTFAAGWATPASSGQRMRYKKVGNVVHVFGGMAYSGAGGTVTMGTLPVGFRPPANFPVITYRDTDGIAVRTFINADGTVSALSVQNGENRYVNASFQAA